MDQVIASPSTGKVISFFVPGHPAGWKRPTTSTHYRDAKTGELKPRKFAITFDPPENKNWKATCQQHARNAMPDGCGIVGPVRAEFVFVFAVPASWSGKKQREALAGAVLPEVKPDCDNIQGLVQDAINALCYRDDVCIVQWSGQKVYGEWPGIYVTLSEARMLERVRELAGTDDVAAKRQLALFSHAVAAGQAQARVDEVARGASTPF
jgi:Holliday junction resolvase RusA-like endonuclease